LNVQLIDGRNDKQIWSEVYEKDLVDIFKLQREIAENVAKQIDAKITPAEHRQIEKIPTEDMLAYDFFLKGLDLLNQGNAEDLKNAIPFLEKAVKQDPNFARAYAAMAIAYYYIDIFSYQKTSSEIIHKYAEKAFLLDPQLPQSLIAKGFSYVVVGNYETAVTYFEKALEYHPNSTFVLNYLSDFYTNFLPNTEKYLEYSLKGLELDRSTNDSTAMSFSYLHISNAFLQTGFFEDALLYINLSLEFNSRNIYSQYVKAYIHFAINKDIRETNETLLQILEKDTTRLDVINEVAKTYYNMYDYNASWVYYQKLLKAREEQNMDLFLAENIKIAWVCKELGLRNEEKQLLEEYYAYTQIDNSIYRPLLEGSYYAYIGDTTKALDYFDNFSDKENYHYWVLLLAGEPHLENIRHNPRFKSILNKMEDDFWKKHHVIRQKLENDNLI
jgi:tetratricopeptide (TPR) repeat protein